MLAGRAGAVAAEIARDLAMLDGDGDGAAPRVWTSAEAAVVLGVSRDLEREVDTDECAKRGIAVLRRASGGGTVVVGPGTVQYALLFRHDDAGAAPGLEALRRLGNEAVRRALREAGLRADVAADVSGDLRVGNQKVGGLAMRRRRRATMLHGTLLRDADLALVAAVLRHPVREPAWRGGRPHEDFLANLGPFDAEAFRDALARACADG